MELFMPFGTHCLSDGRVKIRLWAPDHSMIQVCLQPRDGGPLTVPMQALADGWHELITDQITVGDRYAFAVNGLQVPDPASRYQPEDVHGPSEVVDPTQYVWQMSQWQGRPWSDAVVYELHIGTFSAEGTFRGAIQHLDHLVNLGITCIELMPLADFPGQHNWGYDGVLLFAPDSAYGHPDDLKALIDACHQRGIMVLLDMVYNHFGPEGNYLWCYATPFFTDRYQTPWGAAINFDGEHSTVVRQFFIQNALYWLNEYHFDGIRFDAVHCINDSGTPHFLSELAQQIRAHTPREYVHLILENDGNHSRYLPQQGQLQDRYNAQWNDDIHHIMHVLATGECNGYYQDYAQDTAQRLARCLAKGFDYQGETSPYRQGRVRGEDSTGLPLHAFVSFIQNHDHIGNRALGERIVDLAPTMKLEAMVAIMLLSPQIPLLYMGEEWGCQTPFFFFCDFEPNLSDAVREGRKQEFSKFPEFQDPKMQQRIPDPCAASTFHASKLDWQGQSQAAAQQWFSYYRQLLQLRQTELKPLIAQACVDHSDYQCDGDLITVCWRTAEAHWWLRANLGDTVLPAQTMSGDCLFQLRAHDSSGIPPWDVALYRNPV